MKRKYNAAACMLMALALLLMGAGLWNTMGAQEELQYVLAAPDEEGAIQRLAQKKDDALEELAEALSASAVTATANGVFISADDAGTSAQATLIAGGEGFFEVSPRYLVQGRLISETELKRGEKKAVLDEDLAFQLFPTVDPIGQMVMIGANEMEIVGVVRHSRRVGEADLFSVYAPLLAVQDVDFEIVTLSAIPLPGSGATVMFEDTASGFWQGGGFFYNIEKEAVRARLPVMYVLVIFGIAAVVWAMKRLNRLTAGAIGDIRQRLEREYAARLVPGIALRTVGLLIAYAALAGAAWLIGSWAVEPLYLFPEWVPENIVEWSAIREVFWNLATQGVRMTSAATPQVRALQFWAGVVQWGALLTLTSAVLLLIGRKRAE